VGLLEVLRCAATRGASLELEPRVLRAAAQSEAALEAADPTAGAAAAGRPRRAQRDVAVDFMSDMLYGGTRFQTLNVLDEGNREALAVKVALSLPAER
jgi:hypothetical protein